ncbi:hypothetical protein GGF32_000200 [Allomyces javanicus]|nr:hypothetical protein GGF32_000200 [Allomyces javanicus]
MAVEALAARIDDEDKLRRMVARMDEDGSDLDDGDVSAFEDDGSDEATDDKSDEAVDVIETDTE